MRHRLICISAAAVLFASQTHGQCVQWLNRSPVANSPGDLGGCSYNPMVYDSLRNVCYEVGGSNRFGFPSALTCQWLNASTSWSAVSNTTPLRYMHRAIYDSVRDRVFLFGGYAGPPNYEARNDTWSMNPATGAWTAMNTATSPPLLSLPNMVFDSARGVIVLFGGYNQTSQQNSNETWEFNGTNWVRRFPASSPDPRNSPLMAYDSDRQVVVLYGGTTQTSAAFPPDRSDTWEYNGTSWIQTSASSAPGGRAGFTMVYDRTNHRTIFHSGAGDISATDTWAYAPPFWNRIATTGAVGGITANMAFDNARGVTLFIGGQSSATVMELASSTAVVISTQPQSQSIRAGFAATFSVVASGTGTISYQWRRNAVDIAGATNSSYTISECVPSNQADYSVVVTNFCGSVTSANATLTVQTLPECPGDFNGDGSLDFFDYLDFVDAFSIGC